MKEKELKEEKKPKTQLEVFLKENEQYHYNFHEEQTFRISSGSIALDAALEGGFPPGIHRFGGASEGGKTSESLEIIKNFLETVPNSKALYVKAEGRMSKKMQKRSGIKFVSDAAEWVPGTCYILKMNIYEPMAQFIYELITINPENFKYAFVIDSLDGLMRVEDAAKGFDEAVKVCGPNVLTKLLFKKISLPMSELCHLMIVIVQIIAKIDAKYEKKDQLAISGGGGNAAIHFANYILTFMPRYQKDLILSGSGDTVNYNFGESNIIGHWANVLLEKTENEKSQQKVKYPIKYKTPTEDGRIWHELEIKNILFNCGFITQKGAWIKFSENSLKSMGEAGITDIPLQIQGAAKFNEYISNEKVLNFWVKTLREFLGKDDLL